MEQTIKQIKENDIRLSQICIIEVEDVRVGEMSFGIRENFAEIGIKRCDASYQNYGNGSSFLRILIDYLFTDEKINNVVKIEKI